MNLLMYLSCYKFCRCAGFCVPGNPNDRLDFTSSDWQQHAGIIVKPATLLFKVLNSSPAPLKEEERPQLLAGPLLKALGLQGKLKAGKVVSLPPFAMSCVLPVMCASPTFIWVTMYAGKLHAPGGGQYAKLLVV